MRGAAWAPLAIRTAFVVLALLLWDFCVRFGWVNALFLAGPIDTLEKLGPTTVMALPHLYATLSAFTVAFVLGVLLALVIGYAICLHGYSYKVFMPFLVLGVTVPKVTLLPLFILWFGIEKTTIIVYGALSAFFPMIVNVMAASLEVKPSQLALARAMGCSRAQTFTKVIFPSMLPVLSSGCFYACNAALMGIFIVELALSRFGMGALVHDLAVTFKTPELYAAVLLTAAITVAINMALWYAARHFSRWRN